MSAIALIDVQDSNQRKPAKVTKDRNVVEDCQLFGKRLLQSMERCNISQSDLHRFMEVSRSAVSLWVQGVTYPSIDNIKKIANYLRTTPEYLLFGVVHVAEERLVESIPVVYRNEGQQVEFTRLTLPKEFMARAHLTSKNLKAMSMFSADADVIAITDTADRTINVREPKMMVIEHGGKLEIGSAVKKPGDANTITFETAERTFELPYDDKMVIGRLAASVTATHKQP